MLPETVTIAISRKDGGVSIMQFITKSYRPKEREGDEDIIEFQRKASPKNVESEIAKTGIDVKSWRIINSSEVPIDRTFRDAWEDKNGFGVNMTRAREIHMNSIRTARRRALQEADIDFTHAQGKGDADEATKIEAHRQKLRNLPQTFKLDGATSPEALKVLWPEELKGE